MATEVDSRMRYNIDGLGFVFGLFVGSNFLREGVRHGARTEKADPAVIYVTAQICRWTEEEVVPTAGLPTP